MQRAYYSSTCSAFVGADKDKILGELTRNHAFELEHLQRNAWIAQINHLKEVLVGTPDAFIMLEYAIPRMGKRADVVLLIDGVIYVLEYKVGEKGYPPHALEQAQDYALDLKNFHEGSHLVPVVPILVATEAPEVKPAPVWAPDLVAEPAKATYSNLLQVIESYQPNTYPPIKPENWISAGYKPTPTIIEAARALYDNHKVEEISRADAGAVNLSRTSAAIAEAIEYARVNKQKTVCFVTGVPGSGKTLAGLNLATERMRAHEDEHAVFLSGNGPLVTVLREALVRDEVQRSKASGQLLTKKVAQSHVHAFIQNIHHFRDENLRQLAAPVERVVVFDEAQRAWSREQTSKFMREKRQQADFDMSEPNFLLSVMDRHDEWCVVVCLIGGGQEINTGEAGISEWFAAIEESYPHWRVLHSHRLHGNAQDRADTAKSVISSDSVVEPALHLAVNVRSFRAERVSDFVRSAIDGDSKGARATLANITNYPIVLTRSLPEARAWLRDQARGSERYGLVASSKALRLRPEGIHVKAKVDEASWFLNDKNDVRSSFALEEAATEFSIQGLELDWVGVCWDANFRWTNEGWGFHAFKGNRWQNINNLTRRAYLANSYRVLLTRARQGMVIFVPEGSGTDSSRPSHFFDTTYQFLQDCGLRPLAT